MKLQYPSISLRRFALAYEDLPAFHAAYLMLVLVFAGLCNLGFFACLIVAHIALDYMKYRVRFNFDPVTAMRGMVRESLLDVSLLFLALSTFVYLHPSLNSISGLGTTEQLHVTIMRGLALLLPKLTILHHTLRIAFDVPGYLSTPHPRLKKQFSLVEYVCAFTFFIALALLAVAPGLLGIDLDQFRMILSSQLVPWRF